MTTARITGGGITQAPTRHFLYDLYPTIYELMERGTVYVAHRGAAYRYPENTNEAYAACLADDLSVLEVDFYPLSDGELGVFHSTTVDELTTSSGDTNSLDTSGFEALTLDAGVWHGGGFGNLSPIMANDFLSTYKGNIVIPEAKYPTSGDTEALGNAVVSALSGNGIKNKQCVVQSFSLTPLGPVVDAGYPAMILEDPSNTETIATAQAAGVTFAGVSQLSSDARIGEWLSAGFYVFGWTANRRVERDRLISLGVHGIISDDPEYVAADAPFSTEDNFASGEWQPGMVAYNDIGGGPTINNRKEEARGRFAGSDQWGYDGHNANVYRGCLMGHMCPVGSDPDNNEWLLDFKVEFGEVDNADQTRWVGVAVHSTDERFTDGSQSASFSDHADAYLFLFRKDGLFAIYRRPFSSSTLLAADGGSGAAISDDEEVRFQIEINATKLTMRRLDGGGSTVHELVSYDVDPGGFRGGYFHLGHNRVPALFRDVSVGSSTAYNLWTPAQVSPYVWLGDDSVKYLSGSDVFQWQDYAGNGTLHHFAEGTNRPTIQSGLINSLDAVRFNGTNDTLDGPSSVLGIHRNVDYGWIFAVYYLDSTTDVERPVFITTVGTGGGSRCYLSAGNSSGQTPFIGGRRLDGDSFHQAISSTEYSEQWVMALGIMDYGERTITLYINGEQEAQETGQFTAAGSTSDTNSQGARLGTNDTPNTFFSGDIACAFSGSSTGGTDELSSDDIDKLFGWAAHRYGLTDNLDAGHPYKSAAPEA